VSSSIPAMERTMIKLQIMKGKTENSVKWWFLIQGHQEAVSQGLIIGNSFAQAVEE
jgi:hypothetical protein